MPPDDPGRSIPPGDTSSATHAVIKAVAHERDRDPTELYPLYHTIEPDVLDEIFSPSGDSHDV